MPPRQSMIEQHMSEVERYYVDNDAIQQQMPIGSLINQFDASLNDSTEDPLSNFSLERWREQFNDVAASYQTSELIPVIQAIRASDDFSAGHPVVTLGVVSLLSLSVDCRAHFASAPIQDAVPPLTNTVEAANDNESTQEQLARATEQTAGVVRSTGLAAKSIDLLSELEFPHPETSTNKVRTAIRTALEQNNENRLRTLGQEVDRSSKCNWTQSDLTGFVDEKNTGKPFECLLESLWGEWGYGETTVTEGAGGDGGVDVVASNGSEVVGIEAKRYSESQKLRAEDIRKLAGTLPKYDFDEVYLVTSCSVNQTDQAADEASQYENLTVIDGETLATKLSDTPLNPPVFVD